MENIVNKFFKNIISNTKEFFSKEIKDTKKTGSRSFGAFSGVFIPTFLSIIGVILFLRLGRIVGGAGLFGAIAIILIAISVTLSTGLSISSIASNIRIGAGGAYSIISRTLGLEIGGSIGIPLYLAQSFSVALYLFGFAEAWQFIFPNHSITTISIITFIFIFGISIFSTKGVVKLQTVVFFLICISLITIFLGGFSSTDLSTPLRITEGPSFWALFAIFFPAVTGLMSGIGMSGELSDPKRQIPKGVLYGLGFTTLIYLGMSVLIALNVTPEVLLNNDLILTELSLFPGLVVAGILAATFSSALTMFLAAPRVMLALSENSILPFSKKLKKISEDGEPRNSVIATGIIILPLLFFGSLDLIAQVLTMFFLITYAVINISVFIEQNLGLRSFRPLFKVPRIVPLYGAIASIVIMLLINPYASIFAFISILAIYIMIANKSINQENGDVRSGLFRSLSQWAEEKTRDLPESSLHVWKPNILIPIRSSKSLIANFPLIKSMAYPHGRITILGFKMRKNSRNDDNLREIPNIIDKFSEEKLFTSYSKIDAYDYVDSVIISMEAIESQSFAANILMLPYKDEFLNKTDIEEIMKATSNNKCGLVLSARNEEIGLGTESEIHVWISPRVLNRNLFEDSYYDLSMLLAYSIKKNWEGNINVWMCVNDLKEKKKAKRYLDRLLYESRFPKSTKTNVIISDFETVFKQAPRNDIHIIPIEPTDLDSIEKIKNLDDKTCLFIEDSSKESVLS